MKPRHSAVLALAALLVTLTGCYSVGAQVNEDQLAGFEKGRTTYSDIVSQLGPPTSQSVNSEGGRTASWLYAEVMKSRPESFIPLIGPFIGGADMKSNMVTMSFDGQGVLKNFNSSSSTSWAAARGSPRAWGRAVAFPTNRAKSTQRSLARRPQRSAP